MSNRGDFPEPKERGSEAGRPDKLSTRTVSRRGLRWKLVLALFVASAIPFGASMVLSERLAADSLALGLNPRVMSSLDELSTLYPELIRTRRALAETRADLLAGLLASCSPPFEDPQSEAEARGLLSSACEEDPHLRGATLRSNDEKLEVACGSNDSSTEESFLELLREIPEGELSLSFGLDKSLMKGHEEAADLAGLYATLDADREAVGSAYRSSFLLLLGSWVVIAALVGLVVANHATRRLEALAEATRRVSAGDLSARANLGGNDELTELGHAFNEMVKELESRGERITYLEKISSWQEIARRLAHEIKNPLTPIQLAMQQLENRWQRTECKDPHFGRLLAESLEIVREEIDTLGRLVGEFSAFARLPDVSPEPTDLSDWTKEFIRTHPDLSERAAMSFEESGQRLMTLIDRGMMRRVLANLVENAIDAAEGDGSIPNVRLSVSGDDEWARLRVSDEGPGMPAEVLAKAFDPYFTTKGTGTGLGLTICKKIVLQHGGTMAAAAPPSGGTIFDIRLPLVK